MSDYRDDETSSVIISETYTAGWGERIQDAAVTAVASFVLITGIVVTDTVTVSEAFAHTTQVTVEDTLTASDTLQNKFSLKQQVTEVVTAADLLSASASDNKTESVTVTEQYVILRGAQLTDTLNVSDAVSDVKHSSRQLIDSLTVADSFSTVNSKQLTDTVSVTDSFVLTGVFATQLTDTLTVSDTFTQNVQGGKNIIDELHVGDAISQHLAAKQLITDTLFIEDVINGAGSGGAWTANVEAFATSRYTNYDFTSIALIRGIPYGTRADGIYRLDGEGSTEVITTTLESSSMDMAGKTLGVPRYVLLGYDSDSSVTLDVLTEQSGRVEEFSYSLPAEAAESATTGRFTLGRGLKGRYFTFKLIATGTYFDAVDMQAVIEETSRRV